MIRHFKWHKKRDESLQHGFMRYSPLDSCEGKFGSCTHDGRQTHYHCLQVSISQTLYHCVQISLIHMHYYCLQVSLIQAHYHCLQISVVQAHYYCLQGSIIQTHQHCHCLQVSFEGKFLEFLAMVISLFVASHCISKHQ